jgi:hypothetical protein
MSSTGVSLLDLNERSTMAKAKDGAVEEPKKSLPVGHPQAGYYGPDLSLRDGAGVLPPEEQAWHDEVNAAHQDAVDAVEAHEDRVADLQDAVEAGGEPEQPAAKKSTSSS